MGPDERVSQAELKLRSGDVGGAYDDIRRVLGEDHKHGRAHYVMSCIATRQGAHDHALRLCEIAAALDGRSAEYLSQLAVCHLHLGVLIEAWTCAKQALDCERAGAEALDRLSDVFRAVEDYQRYAQTARRKLDLAPTSDARLAEFGAALFLCGDLDEARRAVARALATNPNNAHALYGLTEIRAARADDNVVEALVRLIERETDAATLVMLHHALAREYDALGDVERAFASLERGKTAFRLARPYAIQPDLDMFGAIHRYVDAAPPAPANAVTAQPIFVVGMPRSGTTVTQRMLANGGAASIGESLQFGALVRARAGCTSQRLVEAQTVDRRWLGLPLGEIGEAYCAYGFARTEGAPRFVDKLPLNLLYAPLILRALPRARIICLRRHAVDTAFANYRQLLSMNSPSYAYGCSLAATAAFTAESMRLAEKLARLHPEQFHILDYEALAANPNRAGRDLFAFCGLAWSDEAVLIQNNKTPVGSASAAQVQAPIHTGYVGRWRRYERYLGSALAVLKGYGLDIEGGA